MVGARRVVELLQDEFTRLVVETRDVRGDVRPVGFRSGQTRVVQILDPLLGVHQIGRSLHHFDDNAVVRENLRIAVDDRSHVVIERRFDLCDRLGKLPRDVVDHVGQFVLVGDQLGGAGIVRRDQPIVEQLETLLNLLHARADRFDLRDRVLLFDLLAVIIGDLDRRPVKKLCACAIQLALAARYRLVANSGIKGPLATFSPFSAVLNLKVL